MRRLLVVAIVALVALAAASAAPAHRPGSDGGTARKDCGVLSGVSSYGDVGVGATRVTCRTARRIARRSVRGRSVRRWRCTGKGTRFGHCHRRRSKVRRIVHWYAAE